MPTVAAWHDLLGFSASLDDAGWDLGDPSVALLTGRLDLLCQWLDIGGAGHEYLVLNDGAIDTFSPYVYEGSLGSRHDLIAWLNDRLKVHCIVTGIEKDHQLPGLRTMICEGQVLVRDTRTAEHESDISSARITAHSTQLNTALTKCYLADSSGSKAGFAKGGAYIEESVIDRLVRQFGCMLVRDDYLFLYGEPVVANPADYMFTEHYYQPHHTPRTSGLCSDRTTWLKLGVCIDMTYRSLSYRMREVIAFSPDDECAMFWFDAFTGDMHGINPDSVLAVSPDGLPIYTPPPMTDTQEASLTGYLNGLAAYVEQHQCFPHMRGVNSEPSVTNVHVDLGSGPVRFVSTKAGVLVPAGSGRSNADNPQHPWRRTLLAGKALQNALRTGHAADPPPMVGTSDEPPRQPEVLPSEPVRDNDEE